MWTIIQELQYNTRITMKHYTLYQINFIMFITRNWNEFSFRFTELIWGIPLDLRFSSRCYIPPRDGGVSATRFQMRDILAGKALTSTYLGNINKRHLIFDIETIQFVDVFNLAVTSSKLGLTFWRSVHLKRTYNCLNMMFTKIR